MGRHVVWTDGSGERRVAAQGVHCPVRASGAPTENWVADHTHTSLSATGPQPHWRGNGGTQYESPVTAFLPVHSIEMENEEG